MDGNGTCRLLGCRGHGPHGRGWSPVRNLALIM